MVSDLAVAMALACGAVVASPALAQDQVEEREDGLSSAAGGDIVVTARRRSEQLQNVPDSITAFDSTTLSDAGVKTVSDFAKMTPGLLFSSDYTPGGSTITIRGVTQNINSDAPVAFVVDGVTLGNSLLIDQALFDVEQIEVLRGPQGALYGRNSIGGAINITTKKPTNELELRFKAMIGQGNDHRMQASVSGPIIEDKLLFRIAGGVEDRDGLFYNSAIQHPAYYRRAGYGRVKLLAMPTDRLTIDLRAMGGTHRGGSNHWRATNVPDGVVPTDDGLPKEGIIQGDFLAEQKLNYYSFSSRVDYDLDFANIAWISDYTHVAYPFYTDLDFLRVPQASASVDPENSGVLTEELRITSSDDQPLRWLVGGFYQHQKRFRQINVWFGRAPDNSPDLILPSRTANKSYAAFGQVNYDIMDPLELTVAARYDQDDREQVTQALAKSFTSFQPKIQLAYKPSHSLTFYGTYSEGFRSGGFNGTNTYGNSDDGLDGFSYEAEELKNKEVGFKSSFAGGKVRFKGSFYHIDYKNQQFFLYSPTGGQSLVNANKSKVKGFDLEANLRPTPGLIIDLGFAYTDSEIVDFGNTFPDLTGVFPDQVNGKKIVYTPDYDFNAAIQYDFEMGDDLVLTPRFDYRRVGKQYWGFDNIENQKAYDLGTARLTLSKDNWKISGFVENLFGTNYAEFVFVGRYIGDANGVNPYQDGPRRHWGLEAELTF